MRVAHPSDGKIWWNKNLRDKVISKNMPLPRVSQEIFQFLILQFLILHEWDGGENGWGVGVTLRLMYNQRTFLSFTHGLKSCISDKNFKRSQKKYLNLHKLSCAHTVQTWQRVAHLNTLRIPHCPLPGVLRQTTQPQPAKHRGRKLIITTGQRNSDHYC